MSKRADSRYLAEVAYATDAGFNARLSLYEHQQPRIDLVAEVTASLGNIADAVVVDVGCGTGQYIGALGEGGARVVGLDLSVGMLNAARAGTRAPLVVASAGRLPVADASADIVLLLHMLYHLPEPADGIAEAARILRDGGQVVVATNGRDHLREMNEMWLPLLDDAGVLDDVANVGLVNPRLDGDAAQVLLARRFETVTERSLRSTVVVTDPAPVVAHAASTTAGRSVAPQLLGAMTETVETIIGRTGAFRVTTEVALFHASGRL